MSTEVAILLLDMEAASQTARLSSNRRYSRMLPMKYPLLLYNPVQAHHCATAVGYACARSPIPIGRYRTAVYHTCTTKAIVPAEWRRKGLQ